jgi:hypothetical protein
LRDKGLGLAPLVEGGRVVRSKRQSKQAASGGVLPPTTAPQGAVGVITRWDDVRAADRRTAPHAREVTVPAPCPLLNANQKLHRMEEARRVKAWRRAARDAAAAAGLVQDLGRLQIDAYVIKPVANRYDPANYQDTAKAVTDGLIDYGLAEDDNRKILAGPFMHDGGKGSPSLRIVVTVLG